MLVLLACLLACSSPPPEPMTEPPPPPVTATGPVDLLRVVSEVHETQRSIVRVSWEQSRDATMHLEFSFDPGEWRSSPPRDLPAGAHEELLLGVPYETPVTWRLVGEVAGEGATTTEDVSTTTGCAPFGLPVPDLSSGVPDAWDPEVAYVLVSVSYNARFSGEFAVELVDRRGRVVWSHDSPRDFAAMHPRVSRTDRSFLVDHSSHWGGQFDGGARSSVVDLAIDGTVLRRWKTPGLYHAFTDLPDGSIAYPRHWSLDMDDDPGPDGERVVILDPEGGETELFDCLAALQTRCQANTLSYDDDRGVFLYSLFTVESVLELDGTTGAVLKTFGHLAGAWAFDPPSSEFWYQHGGTYTEAGTLLLSTHRSEDDTELVVREYAVDAPNRVLRQVWSFGEGEGVVGEQMGEAHRLHGGNTLHNFGTHAVLREITPEGDVVWDLRWEGREYASGGHTIGRSAPVYGDDLYRFLPPR